MDLGLRVVAGALIASAFTFVVSGSHAHLLETRLMFFAWGLLFGFAGSVLACALYIVSVVRSESDRNARLTSTAVGEAVGEVLQDGEPPTDMPRLPPTRRGT
jgi:hypothetical protein